MPRYDLNLLLNPNLDSYQLGLEKGVIEQILERHQAQVISVDERGSFRLAYPIQKDSQAYLIFYSVEVPRDLVGSLQRELRLRDNIRRVMMVRELPRAQKA